MYTICRTWYKLHFMPYIVWRALYAVHYMTYIIWRTLIDVYCMTYIVSRTLYAVHCMPYIVWRTLYDGYCMTYIVSSTLYHVHYMPYIVWLTLYVLWYRLNRCLGAGIRRYRRELTYISWTIPRVYLVVARSRLPCSLGQRMCCPRGSSPPRRCGGWPCRL